MADITRRIPDCDDDCEGGKREERGSGPRDHDVTRGLAADFWTLCQQIVQ